MYSPTIPASRWRAMSVENIASLVVPMNCSFSVRVYVWPPRRKSSDSTAKCSGSLSMSTPSMSKITASNPAMELARDGANGQDHRGAEGGQQHQLQARARTVMMRFRQQVARADCQEHTGKGGQQQSEDQVVQL